MTAAAEQATGGAVAPGAGGTEACEPLTGRWPHALSHEPLLRVSDVLSLIKSEFPALTLSKLRFYDAQGLVCPQRTSSGYRQYSAADVERVRFVLRQQRDHFRPLTVIAQHLDALDKGTMHERISPQAVNVEDDDYLTAPQLADRAGVTVSVVDDLAEARIIEQAVPGAFDREIVDLVVACGAYLAAGGDVRSLRSLCLAGNREADRADAVVAPLRGKGSHGEAEERARELGESAIAVFGACVRGSLSR
ncbi:MerR family transcriptional regulator [Demequina sp.]|uniref:transcriptional regulator FtsR n=1 Tax=Demequina sp. TaxID=2050685 RepID=UPI003D099A32